MRFGQGLENAEGRRDQCATASCVTPGLIRGPAAARLRRERAQTPRDGRRPRAIERMAWILGSSPRMTECRVGLVPKKHCGSVK